MTDLKPDSEPDIQLVDHDIGARHPTPPPLESRWVRLRPIAPGDYPFLYEMAASPTSGYRWRFRSGMPLFEEFVRTLGNGVQIQYMIESTQDLRQLGTVISYRAEYRNRTTYIAMQGIPEAINRGWLVHAAELFINYLFTCYDFHKLYAESPEFVVDSFRSELGKSFAQEACFKDNERYLGRSWDTYVFAYYRSQWEQAGSRFRKRGNETGLTRSIASDALPLTFDQFRQYLVLELDLENEEVTPESKFVDDLGFDSIRVLELLCVIEDLGVELDDHTVMTLNTVDDAYFHYIQRADH